LDWNILKDSRPRVARAAVFFTVILLEVFREGEEVVSDSSESIQESLIMSVGDMVMVCSEFG
jgi:hypothetical protein